MLQVSKEIIINKLDTLLTITFACKWS